MDDIGPETTPSLYIGISMRFYTVKELSEMLNLSPSQVYALMDSGRLGFHRFTTGRQGAKRVSDTQLQEFLDTTLEATEGGKKSPKQPPAPAGGGFIQLDPDRLRKAWGNG
jgi:excisionase family DNA binding protein